MENCKYQLSQILRIQITDETGQVIARAEYAYCEPQYLLRYKGKDGTAHECWWTESALIA